MGAQRPPKLIPNFIKQSPDDHQMHVMVPGGFLTSHLRGFGGQHGPRKWFFPTASHTLGTQETFLFNVLHVCSYAWHFVARPNGSWNPSKCVFWIILGKRMFQERLGNPPRPRFGWFVHDCWVNAGLLLDYVWDLFLCVMRVLELA